MALVTFDGQIGAGGPEIGRRIARMFDLPYVDKLVLPGHLQLLHGITAPAVGGFRRRLKSYIGRAISGFALGNAAGDPYFEMPEALFYPLTWDHSPEAPRVHAGAARPALPTIDEVVALGSAVVVERAGCIELRAAPRSVRVGLFSPWEDRLRRLMRREGLAEVSAAERLLRAREAAQRDYFHTVHGADPEDPQLYDLCIDTPAGALNESVIEVARTVRRALASGAAV